MKKKLLILAVVFSVLLSLGQISLVSATGEEPPPPPPPLGTITVHKFLDANGNGVQDEGEMDKEGWLIRLYTRVDGVLTLIAEATTGPDGTVTFTGLSTDYVWYKVWEEARWCWAPTTPADIGSYDGGYYVLRKLAPLYPEAFVDFGNTYTCAPQPGTGTPGYWMNHPEAWPVSEITIGGETYSKYEAIEAMKASVAKDKTYTMFPALVAAKLNVLIGNDASCIADTIAAADAWMATYGPVGSGVEASSEAWEMGEPLYEKLDEYNNGELCASSRDDLE